VGRKRTAYYRCRKIVSGQCICSSNAAKSADILSAAGAHDEMRMGDIAERPTDSLERKSD
jgi:hypothetical protein